MYSQKVKELFSELPNRGVLADATNVAKVENPACGDITHLYLRVENGIVEDCRFQTYGCPAAIAASAAVTLLCKDRKLSECLLIDQETVLKFLGGLPSHKLHGADLAVEALRTALKSEPRAR